MLLATPLKQAQSLVSQHVKQGDIVVDATVGNGKDTLFLAQLVGEQGTVYGFDIQRMALDNAEALLKEQLGAGIDDSSGHKHVVLFEQNHAQMLHSIPEHAHGQVAAVMFNLGYLPGGDHSLITVPHSTIPALDASLTLLKEGGLISLMVYRGHDGGQEEAEQVKAWAKKLPQQNYQVLQYEFINQINTPPFLIAIKSK